MKTVLCFFILTAFWLGFQIGALAQVNLANGLIGYYPCNGNANDQSGQGNNGTVSGAVLTSDRFGNSSSAYSFTAKSNYISLANPISAGTVTVSMWYYFSGTGGNWNTLLCRNNGSYHHLLIENGTNRIGFYNSGFYTTGATVSLNQWHHVVLIKTGYESKLYIDNTMIQYSANSFSNSSFPLSVIGNYSTSGPNQGALGVLDDIRIYNRVITSEEMVALYYENRFLTLQPAQNETGVSLHPAFRWNDVPGAVSYRVQLASENAFVASLFDTVVVDTSFQTPATAWLSTNTTYYWRAKAIFSASESNWSYPSAFTTSGYIYMPPISDTTSVANRVLPPIRIEIPTGVDQNLNKPRLYFKKSTQANGLVDNNPASDGWKWVEPASINGNTYQFVADYSLLGGSGITQSTAIQFFVVAQDTLATPGVFINKGSLTLAPSSVQLTAAQFPHVGTPGQYSICFTWTANIWKYITVAESGLGRFARVDVDNGQIIGVYKSSPATDSDGGNPSRTTVDFDGSVWVGNRDESSICKLGLLVGGTRCNSLGVNDPVGDYLKPPFDYPLNAVQKYDKNGDGLIKTSLGIKNSAEHFFGFVNGVPEDELLTYYSGYNNYCSSLSHVRHVSVDSMNNIWIGSHLLGSLGFLKVNGATGEVMSIACNSCGGYGGLVDRNQVLWSSSREPWGLLRRDLATGTETCLSAYGSYGLSVDPVGNIWNANWEEYRVRKFRPDGTLAGNYYIGKRARGLAVTPTDNHVWIANSENNCVTRMDSVGNVISTIAVQNHPTGVSVDYNGKVWITNLGSNSASRINPAVNNGTVDLTVYFASGSAPYNYSDMTGTTLRSLYPERFKPIPVIVGPTNVYPTQSLSYSASTPPGVANQWMVLGGTLTSPATGATVTIEWGNCSLGTVKLTQTLVALGISDSTHLDVTIDIDPATLLAPAPDALDIPLDGNLAWNPAGGATLYQVQVSSDPAFTIPLPMDTTVANTSVSLAGMLCGQSYFWRVRAFNPGCTAEWSAVRSFSTVYLDFELEATDISCLGAGDGALQPVIQHGLGPFSYAWSTGDSLSASLAGLQAGAFGLTITDAHTCTHSETATIHEPPLLVVAAQPHNDFHGFSIDCAGLAHGSAASLVTGGTPPYAYAWSNGQVGPDLAQVPAGIVDLTVTDSRGCQAWTSVTLTEPPQLGILLANTPIQCQGASSTVSVEAVGGVPPYSGTGIFNLPAGTHLLVVSDANGCDGDTTVVISEPPAIVISLTITDIPCHGFHTPVWVEAAGGVPPYSGTGLFDLDGGMHLITVGDAQGCSATQTVTIPEPDPIGAILVYEPLTGGPVLQVTGGVLPYTYLWSNGDTTDQVPNLALSQYPITINDANGCQMQALLQAPAPELVCIPSSLNFGNTIVAGYSGTLGLILANTGNAPGILYDLISNAPFSVDPSLAGEEIPIGGHLVIPVSFSPGAALFYSGDLNLQTNDGPFVVPLIGTGTTPLPSFAPSWDSHDFGLCVIGQGASTNLCITNTGNVPILINGFTSSSPDFSIPDLPFNLNPGETHCFGVGFNPGSVNGFTGTLGISSPTAGSTSIFVSGSGYVPTQAPTLTFSDNYMYQGVAGVFPGVGQTSQLFQYQVVYTDPDNDAPMAGYPKLGIDRNGDQDYLDLLPAEGWIDLTEADPLDQTYSDGKTYLYSTNLSLNQTLGYAFVAFDVFGNPAIDEGSVYHPGPIVSNDLLDLSIFANDISFSNSNPEPNELITITAVIHNNSYYTAENFCVSLYEEDTFITSILVPYLGPNSQTSVSVQHSFPVDQFYPIKVVIDEDNLIAEDNELNNFAIRPVIVGQFSTAAAITGTISLSPSYKPNPWPQTLIGVNVHASYLGTLDPNIQVSGAFVSLTVTETGEMMTGYTNAWGDLTAYFWSPSQSGLYHVTGSVTDYTLTGSLTPGTLYIDLIVNNPVDPMPDLATYSWYPWYWWYGECSKTISGSFSNVGNATANDALINVYADGVLIHSELYPSIPPGAGGSYSHTFSTPGPHSLSIVCDPVNSVPEFNESNNSSSAGKMVYPDVTDLSPTWMWANFNPWSTAYVGQPIGVGIRVHNLECIPNDPTTLAIYDIYGLDTTLIHTLPLATISGRSWTDLYLSHVFSQPGDHLIRAYVDPSFLVNESNENNQVYQILIHVEPLVAELNFSSIQLSSVYANPGDPINFTATLNNQGVGAAVDFYACFYVDNVPLGVPQHIASLGPVSSMVLYSPVWVLPDSCPHQVTVRVDEANTVMEINEFNNELSKGLGIDVSPSLYPIYPTSSIHIAAGANVSLYSVIRNFGSFNADSVIVSYSVGGSLLGLDVVPNILGNGSYAVSHINHVFTTPGTFQVLIVADTWIGANPRFCEISETNNTTMLEVVVGYLPDLRVLSHHISPTELNPDPNEPIQIFGSFENIGYSPAGPFSMRFFVNSIPLGDLVSVPGLGIGEDSTVACTLPWSSSQVGTHVIRVQADALNEVEETNEGNNLASRAIIVGDAPDLTFATVEGLTLSDYFPMVNTQLTIETRLVNHGGATGTGTVAWYLESQAGTVFLSSQPVTLDPAGTATLTTFFTTPVDFGTIRAVISNVSPDEFNELNNEISVQFGSQLPYIVTGPAGLTVCVGEPASFSCFAIGGIVNFKWFKGEVELSGETGPTLGIPITAWTDAGQYRCVVYNSLGADTSVWASLEVNPLPAVDLGPDTSITAGQNLLLTGGAGSGNYTWSNGQTTASILVTDSGTYTLTVTNAQGCQAIDGIMVSVTGELDTQILFLPEGWSAFSTYIHVNQEMSAFMGPVSGQVVIVKNGLGEVYWPLPGVNTIGLYNNAHGYQVKMLGPQLLSVSGLVIEPGNFPLAVPDHWSLQPYLRKSPAAIQVMLQPLQSSLVIAKADDGTIFWPFYGLNAIGNMNPGKAYYLLLTNPGTLYYPSNSVQVPQSSAKTAPALHFGRPVNTGEGMILGLEPDRLGPLTTGCELGVFDQTGRLVGATLLEGSFAALTLWGDDPLSPEKDGLSPGEPFQLRYWDPASGQVTELVITDWEEGKGEYQPNGISIIGKAEAVGDSRETILLPTSPNPFSQETTFRFRVPETGMVEMEIFDELGRHVTTLLNQEMAGGWHTLRWEAGPYQAGQYLARLRFQSQTARQVISKIR